jgi:hypothetical protein
MLTQQDLIDRLNQLTLRYNLTWFDIKYDADKAITKINNFLGAKYPKLSDYLKAPTDTYSITTTIEDVTTEYEIIKEEYFHAVIIPYIAMEILSRDEEFTTIYNKYTVEMQEGLYDMFQKEFNRLPFEFRQNPDQGVFFGLETAQGIIQHNERNLNIPTFKFKVSYYPNNNKLAITSAFPVDTKTYVYDEEAKILFLAAPNNLFYGTDGATAFTFAGWARERNAAGLVIGSSYVEVPNEDTMIKMRADLNLYAFWNTSSTLLITASGVVSISSIHRPQLINLIIPEYVNGIPVITIPTNFTAANAPQADILTGGIYLPPTVDIISPAAFIDFKGTTVNLNEGLISIGANAFSSTPNLKEIIIPASVTTISAGAFPVVANKRLVIKARVLEANKPVGWVNAPASPLSQTFNLANNNNVVVASSGTVVSGISVGQAVEGNGIPVNTFVVSVSSNQIELSNNATSTSNNITLTFSGWYSLSNVNSNYSVEVIWGYNGA